MRAHTLMGHLKRLFPDLMDYGDVTYRLGRDGKLLVYSKFISLGMPHYTFSYRSDVDWELKYGRDTK